MRFKTWLYQEIGGNGPIGSPEIEEVPVTAVQGIFDKKDDPPKPAKTATSGYVQTRKYSKKKCHKS